MEIGTAILIIIAVMMLLFTLITHITDYLRRRDDRTRWHADVDSDRNSFKAFVASIKQDIEKIHSRIDDIFGKLGGPATLKNASPTTLTELGQSISETLGASAWAEERAPGLLERVTNAGAYDIQVFAYQYVEEEFTPNPAMEATIKQCAYENGLRRKQVINVLAIELRDRLLRLCQLEPHDRPEG